MSPVGVALMRRNPDPLPDATLDPMSDSRIELEASENHEWLLGEFVRLLLRQRPDSVLDVGCGAGLLLKACHRNGIETIGVDQPGPRLDALREEGFDVREGTAYSLAFEDRSVDWVTMRHVPHHLEDPARAFAEALRVSREGLIVAEPYFDPSLPSQRTAIALDRWEKGQHRRRGMYHAEVIDLGPLLDLMPEGYESRFRIETQRSLRLRRRSIADFQRDAEALLADLPESRTERDSLAGLLVELEESGLTWNGSLCVCLRRR